MPTKTETGYGSVESYEEFQEILDMSGEYGLDELDSLKEFYQENHEEHGLRDVVIEALKNSPCEGSRDMQLMAILSSPRVENHHGEQIEEDCHIGEQSYRI